MRDIYYPHARKPVLPPQTEQTTKPSPVSTVFNQPKGAVFSYVQKTVNWASRLFVDYSPEVITPSHPSAQVKPLKVLEDAEGARTITHKKPRKHAQSPAGKRRRNVAHAIRQAISTPVGRYATAHSLIAITLITAFLVSYRRQPAELLQPRNMGQTAVTELQRYQFLPEPGDLRKTKEFNSAQESLVRKNVSFYTWITPWNHEEVSNDHGKYRSLSAFWLTVTSNGYEFEPKAPWRIWQNYANTHSPDGRTYFLTVSGDPDYTSLALDSAEVRRKHIESLLAHVKQYGFTGIDIDYEGLGAQNRDLFSSFIEELSGAFHAEGKQVAVTVEARLGLEQPMDWQKLGESADELRIMAYDYHSRLTNQPGSIAPLGWLKEILDYATTVVPAKKVVLGIGNYGYDWAKPSDPSESWQGIGVSYDSATTLAQQHGATVERSSGIDSRGYDQGKTPHFSYTDGQNIPHEVWFEDSVSLQPKIDLAGTYDLKGIIFWSVGMLDQRVWNQNTPSS